MFSLSVPIESLDSITLILLSHPAMRRLSIQYVYERVSFLFRLCCKAGAKVENLFQTGKCFLKFFLENFFSFFPSKPYQSFNELSVFCGVQM